MGLRFSTVGARASSPSRRRRRHRGRRLRRVAAVEGLAESAHAATDDVGVRGETKRRLFRDGHGVARETEARRRGRGARAGVPAEEYMSANVFGSRCARRMPVAPFARV